MQSHVGIDANEAADMVTKEAISGNKHFYTTTRLQIIS